MWDYFSILSEENATVLRQQIKQQANKVKVDWSFKWFKYIKDHPEQPWNYKSMCSNPNVTWELIQANFVLLNYYSEMCRNPNITWDIIQTFPQTTDIFYYASRNPNITLDIFNQYPDKPWDYGKLAGNSNFTFYEMKNDSNWKKFIRNPPHLWFISRNPNITWEIIVENYSINWNYDALSKHANISWEIIQANPQIKWDYYLMRANPNVT